MDFYSAAATDAGTRRKENQDNLYVEQFVTEQGKIAFAVLCDGMGGMEHGEIASEMLVSAFYQWAKDALRGEPRLPLEEDTIRRQWTEAVAAQNEAIRVRGKEMGCVMGTTVTALLLTESRYYILNIGDSRAYELGTEVRQLTEDHTVLADEVRLGNISPEQARNAPMNDVLTRCVGIDPEVRPDFFAGDTKAGAVYMLCSDGFRHCVTEAEMLEALMPRNQQYITWLKEANEFLISLNKARGETDNISVAAIYTGQ